VTILTVCRNKKPIICSRIIYAIKSDLKQWLKVILTSFIDEKKSKSQNFENPLFYLQKWKDPNNSKSSQKSQNIVFFIFKNT